MSDTLTPLVEALRQFNAARQWGRFHSPKNLACALSVEAAELLEQFQWLSEAESSSLDEQRLAQVREELADVLLYLLQIADTLHIDLVEAARAKLRTNEAKYPVDKATGTSKKYTEL